MEIIMVERNSFVLEINLSITQIHRPINDIGSHASIHKYLISPISDVVLIFILFQLTAW